jgi:hypothetical protein
MARRASGFARVPDEQYETITWPVLAMLHHLPGIRHVWDPYDRGSGKLVDTLLVRKIDAYGTEHHFLTINEPPSLTDAIITNPPYGENRRGEMAVAFIEHALRLKIPRVAMLLRNDFDSALSRQHLFRNEPRFAFKLVLLNRIKNGSRAQAALPIIIRGFAGCRTTKTCPPSATSSREEAMR